MELNKLIGYTCSYIPAELLSATGYKPYRLLHGSYDLSIEGEKALRIDACPLIRSNLGFLMRNQEKFKAIIVSTGCDMSRRLSDVLLELTDIPVFVFNNPRTDNFRIYSDEINQLVVELEILGKRKLDRIVLKNEIERYETARLNLGKLDMKRWTSPSTLSTTTLHKILSNFHQGNIEDINYAINDEPSIKPRVFLLGSPVSYETNSLLAMIENKLRIVGDFNCGLSRFLDIQIKEKNLDGIKTAYFQQPPCIFKRPNDKFYQQVKEKIKLTRATGIVVWVAEFCDNYDFEIITMEDCFELPLLKLKSDYLLENIGQLNTRIEAFVEMLGATRQSII